MKENTPKGQRRINAKSKKKKNFSLSQTSALIVLLLATTLTVHRTRVVETWASLNAISFHGLQALSVVVDALLHCLRNVHRLRTKSASQVAQTLVTAKKSVKDCGPVYPCWKTPQRSSSDGATPSH